MPTDAERDRLRGVIVRMLPRQACNRISGCPDKIVLLSAGRVAVPVLLDALAKQPRADAHWVVAVIDVLGQLDDDRAVPPLEALLDDRRWEIPVRAAQALGRLGRPRSRAPLAAALATADASGNRSVVAATRFALSRVDPTNAAAHRKALETALPHDMAALGQVPPVEIDVTLEMVREARLPRALPAARIAALHTNRFVRAQALDTLAALQDTGGVPFALGRLDDPLPSIRAKALKALQRITGIRTMTDPKQWRKWARANGLEHAELPAGAAPPVP